MTGGVIGIVSVTAAGAAAAAQVSRSLQQQGCEVRTYGGSAGDALPRAFAECTAVVAFLAVGAAVRLVAPLLQGKAHDPGLVCVDEAARWAVPVLGGHGGGANALAGQVAAVLGGAAVLTTATDATGVPGLDSLGWPVEGDVAGLTRALLDGDDVDLVQDAVRPLPALGLRPGQVGDHPQAAHRLHVTDRTASVPSTGEVVLRPPSLVLGVGSSRGASADDVRALALQTLHDNGLSLGSVAEVVSIDLKADEPGIVALAGSLGVPLRTFTAAELDAHAVPTPSDVVAAATGSRSVAEASVLQAGATLVVPKQKNAVATVAVGRLVPRGRLALVGIGPGARDLMVPRAVTELRRAAVVIGLDQYVVQVRDLLRPGTTVLESGLGSEEERARTSVSLAQQGFAVAVVGSGDAGVYAMASPTLEALEQALDDGPAIEVVGVPGVTAALAASAALGAALGNDHAYVSLSDLHTPWPVIERRLRAVAEGDLVACLYNPRSARRTSQLPTALRLLGAGRPASTPVGVVRNVSRPDETVRLSTLADLDPASVDMYSVVVVGCSQSRGVDGHLVTPR
ncbi:MAG TPA: cobalamin biosynthesis protein, partial [Actinomycetales bacterium]